MAVTLAGSGTQTAVVGTEQTLLDVSTAGVYVLLVDKTNMAAGDVLELRVYVIILTGGTRKVAYFDRVVDAAVADDMIEISVPVPNDLTDSGSVRFTLKQTLGTARTYQWKVLSL